MFLEYYLLKYVNRQFFINLLSSEHSTKVMMHLKMNKDLKMIAIAIEQHRRNYRIASFWLQLFVLKFNKFIESLYGETLDWNAHCT